MTLQRARVCLFVTFLLFLNVSAPNIAGAQGSPMISGGGSGRSSCSYCQRAFSYYERQCKRFHDNRRAVCLKDVWEDYKICNRSCIR